MITLENDLLRLSFDRRGAALVELVYKPLDRILTPQIADRTTPHHYHGTIVGPIANRIAGARFAIGDDVFNLDANEGANTLHGGALGLSELIWDARTTANEVAFTMHLDDGHMGFPGPCEFHVAYTLADTGVELTLNAQSGRLNAFNLAPHFYFNVAGGGTIDDHELQIDAAHYLPVNGVNIPTGEIAAVDGTPFDFRQPRRIGDTKFDHNFYLDGVGMREVLTLASDDLSMRIISNQPGVQIYDGRHIGRSHLAIEPQGWPNAVNEASFREYSDPIGKQMHHHSRFVFSARNSFCQ